MFDTLGHIEMGDKAHVGFVYAHAERHSRHHNNIVFMRKAALVFLAHVHAQTGMIRNRLQAVFTQKLRHIFDFFAT